MYFTSVFSSHFFNFPDPGTDIVLVSRRDQKHELSHPSLISLLFNIFRRSCELYSSSHHKNLLFLIFK